MLATVLARGAGWIVVDGLLRLEAVTLREILPEVVQRWFPEIADRAEALE